MTRKQNNLVLYVLAGFILLVAASYVANRVSAHNEARERQALEELEWHRLTLVTSQAYHQGTDFIAAFQLTDEQGMPLEAELRAHFYETPDSFIDIKTDYTGRGTITLPIEKPGYQTLVIAVDSALGEEYFLRDIYVTESDGINLVVHFDKGLYNPGDDVLFRILAVDNATAVPFGRSDFIVSIFDGNDNRVFRQNARTSDFGIISGRFSLADEVNSGFYRFTVEHDNEIVLETWFEVHPFVLPQFEVNVQTERGEYRVGDSINLTGFAEYFFGEPVNQGTVSIYIQNQREFSAELEQGGRFSFSFTAEREGAHHILVEVIDNSNFRQEAFLSVMVTDAALRIDLMPEFGYLVRGMPNTVYIFTENIAGEPTRAHLQVTGRNFSRQVATDANGIGFFVLQDVEDFDHITVRGVDMYGNEAQRVFSFAVLVRNVTLGTNRPRFEMGETIFLNLNSIERGGYFNVFVFRDNRLLKTLTTENDRAAINLGDVYGLIDIYAIWTPTQDIASYEFISSAHRTVFIDPGRMMQLTVQSDRPEYRPGEFVNLRIGVTDNYGIPLDAALLVNIVDQAVLSVAANDLSICNIRLALEGIRFSAELDAATLYASLIAGASEQAITRILLRQDSSSPRVNTLFLTNNPPYMPSRFGFGSAFLNFLLIYALIGTSIAFFVALRKRIVADNNNLSATSLPQDKDKKWLPVGVVSLSLAAFMFALLFLSACAREPEPALAPQMGMPAPAADAAPAAPAPAPAEAPAIGEALPVPVLPAAPPPVAEAPVEMDYVPAIMDEIETQTARVRRLFLETMLFVPELIARDGQASLDFMLADNITTWNIQVVGNTMDGIIGHTESSIRAFQPFFVDFELPRNSIRNDQVSIPVTVFNYTGQDRYVILTIAELDWFYMHTEPVHTLFVPSNQSLMVYIPITILQFGDFVFRAYADTIGYADAAERSIRVNPEGFGVNRVVSSGTIESSTWRHILFMDEHIESTRRATVTFYPSAMSKVIEGMENIFRMPFGCFEQTSSILYPNILALRYMEQQNIINPELRSRALRYISSGYQMLLTFEVSGTPGGFSLFGEAPAESVLTAYGLMQLRALSDVYTIDLRVLNRTMEFLFDSQNANGSFEIRGRNLGGLTQDERFIATAYITWALSEAFPTDTRLTASVNYLAAQIDTIEDNYTLALIANALVNTGHAQAQQAVNRLFDNVVRQGDSAFLTSTSRDFMGAFGRMQDLQTTALASIAFSGQNAHQNTNNLLINYVIASRDAWGTWHTTQATILCLKALVRHDLATPPQEGRIILTLGDEQRVINITHGNSLDFYQEVFRNLNRENILDIQFQGLERMVYKISLGYFVPYDSVALNRGFEITSRMPTELNLHEWVEQEIRVINTSGMFVDNILVAITIPQGFRVERSSLNAMRHLGIIERYETRFDNINLYLRDMEHGQIVDLVIAYRPAFPVLVTGGHARVYDYYNPSLEGFLMPVSIYVTG